MGRMWHGWGVTASRFISDCGSRGLFGGFWRSWRDAGGERERRWESVVRPWEAVQSIVRRCYANFAFVLISFDFGIFLFFCAIICVHVCRLQSFHQMVLSSLILSLSLSFEHTYPLHRRKSPATPSSADKAIDIFSDYPPIRFGFVTIPVPYSSFIEASIKGTNNVEVGVGGSGRGSRESEFEFWGNESGSLESIWIVVGKERGKREFKCFCWEGEREKKERQRWRLSPSTEACGVFPPRGGVGHRVLPRILHRLWVHIPIRRTTAFVRSGEIGFASIIIFGRILSGRVWKIIHVRFDMTSQYSRPFPVDREVTLPRSNSFPLTPAETVLYLLSPQQARRYAHPAYQSMIASDDSPLVQVWGEE